MKEADGIHLPCKVKNIRHFVAGNHIQASGLLDEEDAHPTFSSGE